LVPTVISAAVFLLRHLLPGRAGIFKL
jgi:hypothetical protein